MHELSLASSLVESAQTIAEENKAKKVLNITVKVGVLSGIEKEALLFCFSEVTSGTLLEKAELIIEEVPLKVMCERCHEESSPDMVTLSCAHCGATAIKIISGRELQLIDMEVE